MSAVLGYIGLAQRPDGVWEAMTSVCRKEQAEATLDHFRKHPVLIGTGVEPVDYKVCSVGSQPDD